MVIATSMLSLRARFIAACRCSHSYVACAVLAFACVIARSFSALEFFLDDCIGSGPAFSRRMCIVRRPLQQAMVVVGDEVLCNTCGVRFAAETSLIAPQCTECQALVIGDERVPSVIGSDAETASAQVVPSAPASTALSPAASAPASKALSVRVPVKFRCDYCDGMFEPETVMVKSKKAETWKCKGCHTQISTVQRHFGSWPPPQWSAMTPQQQSEFFQIPDAKKHHLLKQITQSVTHAKGHEEVDRVLGEFLPKSVWEGRGDVFPESFEDDCPPECKQWNALLKCWGYYMVVRSMAKSDSKTSTDATTIDGIFGRQRAILNQTGAVSVTGKASLCDVSSGDESETSASGGDAHARAAKLKRKTKKVRDAAKAKEKALAADAKRKAEKQQAKEDKAKRLKKKQEQVDTTQRRLEERTKDKCEKASAARKESAKVVLAKVTADLAALQVAKDNGFFGELAASTADKIEEGLEKAMALKKAAFLTSLDGTNASLSADAKTAADVRRELGPYMKAVQVATGVFNLLAK